MRIVSFVPAATQIVCALGRRTDLVGVTHECDSLVDLLGPGGERPEVLTRSRLPTGGSSSAIDGAVRTAAANRNEVVVFDGKRLAALRPELVIIPGVASARTPCTPDPAELRRVCGLLEPVPRPLVHDPHGLSEVLGAVRAVGESIGRGQEAARLVAELRQRIELVRRLAAGALHRPRVALLSWVDPPIGAGGILAELVRLAGGRPMVADREEPARALAWEHVVGVQPELVVLAPCGLAVSRVRSEAATVLPRVAGLADTPAARWGQVHAVEARRFFSAHGIGLVRALEILAVLAHPELPWPDALLPGEASAPVATD